MRPPTIHEILEQCGRLDCLHLFEAQEISTDQLPSLTLEDLREIGVEKLGHRKVILSAIRAAFEAQVSEEPQVSDIAPSSDSNDTSSAARRSAPERPRIFLSYGRKDAHEIAQRLNRDLDAAGFEVWMDEKGITSGSAWPQEIEAALRDSQVVVSLLSPHAVRRAGKDAIDSICLDEITFARTSSPPTPVVPAMVAPCEPPFIIYRLDYVHLMGWRESEDEYRRGFERLVSGIRDALAGKVRYRLWEDRLRPLDFSDYLAQKRRGFVGRDWLFEEIDLWRFHAGERALLVTGDPGAGKSSIVAQLVHTNPGGQIIGYHCCQSNELDTLRPSKFVQSLAAMIASRVPAYAEQLEVPSVREALGDSRCENDPGGAFLEGILQPLRKLPPPEEGVRYILIDALDEALTHTGVTTIVDILAGRMERLPAWLRILATTRNEPAVLQRLSGLRAKSIDASDPRNLADLAAYIRQRLADPVIAERLAEARVTADSAVDRITDRSSGNFLYAVNVLDGIARDLYSFASLAALPRGLDGLYLEYFRRVFGREGTDRCEDAFKRARPLLQVLCAAMEPLSRSELATAIGFDAEDDLPRILRQLAQLLSRSTRASGEETLAFYHKSVADWLVTNPDANPFAISPAQGRKILAEYCRNNLSTGRANPAWYVRRHAVEHFLEAEDWDGAAATLSDLEFIEARAKPRELTLMLQDYTRAASLFPEGENERRARAAGQAALDRYAKGMAAYAATWTRIRAGSGEAEPTLPRPPETVRLWTSEGIAAERKRATETPNRLDIIKAFSVFVATHIAPLQDYSAQLGFAANLARNSAPAGPVHQEGKRRLGPMTCVKLIRRFASGEVYNPYPACQAILEGHEDYLESIALSVDGHRIVSGSRDKTIRIWDAETSECLRVLEGHRNFVGAVTLSADGRRIVSGSWDKTIRIWDAETGECLRVLEGHESSVEAVTLSADGRRIVSGSWDETIRIWDAETGECLRVLEGHETSVLAVALSVDGHRIVSGSWDKTIRIWDAETGESLGVLNGHEDFVASVAFSADDRRMVSASRDNTLRIWDCTSWRCIAVVFLRGITCFAMFSGDRRMVAGFATGRVGFFDLENLPCGPLIATAQREIISEDLPAGPVFARPTCCGQRITVPNTISERIEYWADCGGDGGYTDPALLLNCPSCGTPLRMNPFFVEVKPRSLT